MAAALVVVFAVGTYAAYTYFSATHSAIAVAGPVGYGHQITSTGRTRKAGYGTLAVVMVAVTLFAQSAG